MDQTMDFSRIAVSATAASFVLLAAEAQAGQKWDMPMAYPAGNFHSVNAKNFGECVKTGTKGEIDIVTHPNGALFKGNDIKRAVQTGQTPIGERILSSHENENPLFGVDSVPFLANSYENSVKLWNATRPELEKLLDGQGLVLLYSVPWPPQGFYFKREVNTAGDLVGIKVRSYNSSTAKIAELTKMAPIQLEAAEISQALAAGVIESLITSAVTGQDSKAWEQLTHFYTVEAWLPRNHVIVNKAAWDGLDDATKAIFKDCSAKAEASGLEMSKAANTKALETLAKNNMKVLAPSAELAKSLREVGDQVTKQWTEKAGANGKAIIDAYRK
jgi:TRAP-type C4-dicarboxylate transport system substrate-binding protein